MDLQSEARRRRSKRSGSLLISRGVLILAIGTALLFISLAFLAGFLVGRLRADEGFDVDAAYMLAVEDQHEQVDTKKWDAHVDVPPRSVATSTRTKPSEKPKRAIAVRTKAPLGWFGVQLGAFPSKQEADDFILEHHAFLSKFQIYMVAAEISGRGTWYRVRVGAMQDKGAAVSVRNDLPKELAVNAIIVAYN